MNRDKLIELLEGYYPDPSFLADKILSLHIVSVSLPDDVDIEKQANDALFGFGKGRVGEDDYATGYEEGAKWMKEKRY